MEDVQVYHLAAAGKERGAVVLSVDVVSDAGQNKRSRVDCLYVAPGRLEGDSELRGHDGYQFTSTFDITASFVCLGGVGRNFHLCNLKLAIRIW